LISSHLDIPLDDKNLTNFPKIGGASAAGLIGAPNTPLGDELLTGDDPLLSP
jgi:hypothetical protein